MKALSLLPIVILGLGAASSSAAVIALDLLGKGGIGLLASNENHLVEGLFGSGGEVGPGITFDTITKVLSINVGWGTGNGFTNLSGPATMAHIHGPTTSGGVASFTQNASVRIGLDANPAFFDNNPINGCVFGFTVSLDAAQEAELLAGRWYINIHTTANPSGELRGNIVIPETSSAALGIIGALGLLVRKRR